MTANVSSREWSSTISHSHSSPSCAIVRVRRACNASRLTDSLNAGVRMEIITLRLRLAQPFDCAQGRGDSSPERRNDPLLIVVGHLMIERQHDHCILRLLTACERAGRAPRAGRICRLSMRVHHAAACRNTLVEHALHDAPLVERWLQANSVALPVGARPGWLRCWNDTGYAAQMFDIHRGQFPAPLDDRRETLQLLSANRCLNIGHPVVVRRDG